MATRIAILHTAWDCRWSRPDHRLHGVEQRSQPESLWVCARTPGRQRPMTEEECEKCGFWEIGEFIDPLSRR